MISLYLQIVNPKQPDGVLQLLICNQDLQRSRLLVICAAFWLLLLSAASVVAQEQSAGAQVQAYQRSDSLFAQALSLMPAGQVPAEYRQLVMQPYPGKCPTVLLAEIRRQFHDFSSAQQQALDALFTRPQELPLSYVSTSGRYRIHYSVEDMHAVPTGDADSDGIPDYIEEVAAAFDSSARCLVGQLAYRAPPDDGGVDGPEYDIYVLAQSDGVYGFTTPESPIHSTSRNDFTSYIQIDNDFNNGHFSAGLDGARVTAAHELFHAIQFGYRDAIVASEYFYYELCSSWMEDIVYDDINDYYSAVPVYLGRTDFPFNKFERFTLFNYGAAIWNRMLTHVFGDLNLVRETWELMQSGQTVLPAIDTMLGRRNTDFNEQFTWFSLWNYHTGSRSDTTHFYREGAHFPEVAMRIDRPIFVDTTVVDSTRTLSYAYYRFKTGVAGDYFLTGRFAEQDDWRFAVIVTRPGVPSEMLATRFERGETFTALPESTEIVVIPVNLQALDAPGPGEFANTYAKFRFSLIRVGRQQRDQGIAEIYPNPFIPGRHQQIRFGFEPEIDADLEVRILNANGEVVKTARLADGSSFLNPVSFTWDGRDSEDRPVASGVYLVQLRQGSFMQFRKFAVIRK